MAAPVAQVRHDAGIMQLDSLVAQHESAPLPVRFVAFVAFCSTGNVAFVAFVVFVHYPAAGVMPRARSKASTTLSGMR